MKKPLFGSLRVRFMLLMLATALPAFTVIIYFAFWLHDDSEAHYRSYIKATAEQLVARHRDQIEDTHLLLTTLSHIPELRVGKGPGCSALLAQIKANSPPFLDNLVVVQPDGNILCSALPAGPVINVADMDWFRHGMAASFRVGEYHISRRTGAAVATPTLPIIENGRVVGLIAAGLNLSWINTHALLKSLPTGMSYAVFDARGTFLLRKPDEKPRMGRNIGNTPLWRTVTGFNQATVFRGSSLEGLPHLFAYAPLGPAEQPYARLLVGVPEELADAESLRLLRLAMAALLLVVLMGIAVGGLGGQRLIMLPMQAIFNTVGRVAAGELSVRSGLAPGSDEISRLAGQIDAMATAMEERDRALRRERDKALAYLDVVGVMVVALDREGNVTLANRKTCELLGCDPTGSCVGGNWFDRFIPPEDRETIKQVFQRLMDGVGDLPEHHENQVQTCAGEHRLIAWHNTVLKDENGHIAGTLSAGEDISVLRAIQDEILESRARYRALVDNIPGAVFRCEVDYPWHVEHMSGAIIELTGIEARRFAEGEVLYGKLIHPDDLAGVEQSVSDSISRRQAYRTAYRLRRADGAYRWMLEHGRATYDSDGAPRWRDGVILDITDQKEAELALRASEAKYRLLLENIPHIVWQKDRGNVYVACNAAFAHARSLTPEQIEGKTDFDIYPRELADQYLANDRRMLANGQPEQFETSWDDRGEPRDALVTKVPLRNGEGEITGTLGIAEDITKYNAMRAEQERLQAQLQQAQKMEALGQLTGGIAHDFNNILASVLGFAKLALRRHVPEPDSELAEYLREIITAGERARDLVAKMLVFGRSRPAQPVQSVAPLPLAKEIVKMLAATIRSSIHIETHFEENLPDIAFDAVAFHQVLVNLVINARDAVGDKGRITISLRQRLMNERECSACHQMFSGSYVELAVADNGQGIAPDILPHIFEPFFSTKEIGKGTGMGLAVVHGLVNRAGGHFHVDSEPDGGTTFSVFLPVAVAGQASHTALAAPGTRLAAPPGRVLVVDDEPSILRFLSAALTDSGWQVRAFDSSTLALAAFRDDPEHFDAVITDQTMPELTGIELAAELHRQRPDLPVILCSGYSESLTDETAMKSGVQRYLRKPVDIEILLMALAELSGKTS